MYVEQVLLGARYNHFLSFLRFNVSFTHIVISVLFSDNTHMALLSNISSFILTKYIANRTQPLIYFLCLQLSKPQFEAFLLDLPCFFSPLYSPVDGQANTKVPHLLAAIVRYLCLHSVERRRDRYIIMTACGAYWDDTLPILTCQGVVG